MIKLKAIKPERFQGQAFYKAMIDVAYRTAKDVENDYQKTTTGWKKKPKWQIKVKPSNVGVVTGLGPREITFEVWTDNEIYRYPDYGTKPHIIVPRNKKVLRFKGQLSGKSKKGFVFATHVNHPGFKGYKHSERIQKKWGPLYAERQRKAMHAAAIKSNHAITGK